METNTFIFNESGRLRSGWRATAFVLLWIVGSGLIGTAVFTAISVVSPVSGELLPLAIGSAISLVSALVLGWLMGNYFEDLPFRALGASFTKHWHIHFLLGMLIGGASVSLAVGLAAIAGDFDLALNSNVPGRTIIRTLAGSFVVLAIAAAFEEALFRGYLLQTLTRAGLAWLAIGLTAVFFGAVHLGNSSAGATSSANTIIAGVLFGVAYLKSRDLWFPFGIHLMWNWMQGAFFGVEVSGITELREGSLLTEIDNGPAWLTGGSYGIEGGVAATVALLVTAGLIYILPLRPDPELSALTSRENPRASVS